MGIQEMLNAGETVTIPPGEYEGPFLINRPARVVSDGAWLYVREPGTAALNVSAPGVKLSGLSLSASSSGEPALLAAPDTMLENVRVFGTVIGQTSEEGFFAVPAVLDVGAVPTQTPFEFSIKVDLPVPVRIEAERGCFVSVSSLPAGVSVIGIRLPAARDGSIVRRSVFIKTAVTREMVFTAAACDTAKPLGYAPLLFEPESMEMRTIVPANTAISTPATASVSASVSAAVSAAVSAPTRTPVSASANTTVSTSATAANIPPADVATPPRTVQKITAVPVKKDTTASGITHILPKTAPGEETILTRGMHYPIAPDSRLEIQFIPENNADVDAYIFMHDGNMKMSDSKNLIFFGNDISKDGSVKIIVKTRTAYVDLPRIVGTVNELDFIYGVYDAGEVKGKLRIKTYYETLEITLGGAEVVTAFEIKRTPPGFTLTPLVMPFRRGIRELIRSYGLAVN